MRRKGEKGSFPSSALFVGLCHPLSSFVFPSSSFLCQGWKVPGSWGLPSPPTIGSFPGFRLRVELPGEVSPSSRCTRQWEICVPIPFVPHTCLLHGGLTSWHKDSRRGLILPRQLRSVSWVDETFRERQDRAASGNLSVHGTVRALGRSGRAAHTQQWLLPTLARFPGCLTATL